jgi:nicotinamidase-related amidase
LSAPHYHLPQTGLLLVDPYNDFLSEGGKTWPRLKAIANEVNLIDNLMALVAVARDKGVKIFIVPHRRWEPGDYVNWPHATPYQLAGAEKEIFARGSWGGTFRDDFKPQPGDVVAQEHWGSSGFASTDLDRQLNEYGIRNVILVGLIASTCIEATGRYAMELGYHVTLVKDATADFNHDAMHAFELNAPKYAHAILTTSELIDVLMNLPGDALHPTD